MVAIRFIVNIDSASTQSRRGVDAKARRAQRN
jgi:hypothetical protein